MTASSTPSKWPRIKFNQRCAELANEPFKNLFANHERMTKEDVLKLRPELTDQEACDVAERMNRRLKRIAEIKLRDIIEKLPDWGSSLHKERD